MNVITSYTVTPPGGQSFHACIVNDEGFPVYSDRNGVWEVDPNLTMADLMQPQYDFDEWEIVQDATPHAIEI